MSDDPEPHERKLVLLAGLDLRVRQPEDSCKW